MRQQYLLLGLAGIAGLASAVQPLEWVTVGTSNFPNAKFFPTNCENMDTGAKTNEFWTYNAPSTTDNRSPDYKYYADPTGNLWWEGNSDIYVINNSVGNEEQFQDMLDPEAHSKPAGTLVGALRNTQYNFYSPCYVTSSDEMKVDFFNGWVCNRLYTCSLVPHTVTSMIISKETTTMSVTERPYEYLMAGLTNQMNAANGQIAQIIPYEQTFADNEGNSYSYVAQVENIGNYNLFWTVQAAAQPYPGLHSNPAASSFDEAYNPNDIIFGDAQFPQSASIITFVGLDHEAYSKIDFFQTSFSPAPPSPGCSVSGFAVGAGATGVVSGLLAALSVAAAPETGGASLAITAGIASAGSGVLSIAEAASC